MEDLRWETLRAVSKSKEKERKEAVHGAHAPGGDDVPHGDDINDKSPFFVPQGAHCADEHSVREDERNQALRGRREGCK
jgi:hypothetical protein